MQGNKARDDLQSPLLNSPQGRTRTVPVYGPFGKEVVEVQSSNKDASAGSCLKGLISAAGVGDESPSRRGQSWEVVWTIRSSVWVNFALVLVKIYAFVVSGSMAVLASLVDSVIDLLGQGALMFTNALASGKNHDEYPVGRTRLEPVGVMICAVVMGMASMQVISESSVRLATYWDQTAPPVVYLTKTTVGLLFGVVVLKGVLYFLAMAVWRKSQNDAVKAIAQDNANDVLANIVAIIAPSMIYLGPSFWTADPIAGILISVYIIYTWLMTGFEQVEMIVGKRADPEFLQKVQTMAEEHHNEMQLDQLTAYHFGPRYLVELEVVMPESTTLRESHDAGIRLQHKIETLEEVERCFVHIDYQLRLHDDHDPDVPIDAKLWGGPRRSSPRAEDLEAGGSLLKTKTKSGDVSQG